MADQCRGTVWKSGAVTIRFPTAAVKDKATLRTELNGQFKNENRTFGWKLEGSDWSIMFFPEELQDEFLIAASVPSRLGACLI